MTLADIIVKLRDAQDAINQFKQQIDAMVASVEQPAAVTGDSPTEKVPAVVVPPPPQAYSGEHSA